MDEYLDAATVAVRFDDLGALERWFELVHAVATENADADWARISALLGERAMAAGVDPPVVEQFVEHLRDNDPQPVETVRRMAEHATELPQRYRQLTEQADEGGADQGHRADHAAHEEQDAGTYPEVRHGDSGEWVDYLDAMLTHHGF